MSATGDSQLMDTKKVSELFQKALTCNSIREKNLLLNELRKVMKKHSADFSVSLQENEHLEKEIAEVRTSYSKISDEYQALEKSVKYLSELEFYQAAPDVDALAESVKSIERDISAIAQLKEPDIVRNLQMANLPVERLYLELLDLRENRLRQLIDALKQRIRSAEQRIESASVVVDQFGSVANLLEKVRQLEDENDRLKVRQVRFSVESLLKPRRLSRCDPSTLRALLVALQNELAIARADVIEAQKRSEDSISQLPDDSELLNSILKNPTLEFSDQITEVENELQSLDSEPRSLDAESIENQLIKADSRYAALKEQTLRLRSELTLRKNAENIGSEEGRQKVEKLQQLNERLMTEVQSLQEQSEAAEASKQIISEMLEQITAERDAMKQKVEQLSQSYDDLYNQHLQTRDAFKRTWKSGAGLFKLTEILGEAYLNQVSEPSEVLGQVLKFTKLPDTSSKPQFTQSIPPLFSQFLSDLHIELLKRKATKIKKGTKLEELHKTLSATPPKEELQPIVDEIEQAPARAFEFLSNGKRVSGVFASLIDEIRGETATKFNDYKEELHAKLAQIKTLSEPILCRVRRSMASQTFQPRKNDIETEYIKSEIARLRKAAR